MPRSSQPVRRGVLVPVVLAVSLVLITAALFLLPRANGEPPRAASTAAPSATAQAQATPDRFAALARRHPEDPMALGKPDAPVVMIAYSDFQCPFCGKFARDTEPELIRKYVDTGILRIEWRDFPYLGPESMTAALAARAAGEQGKFWQFHDELYRTPGAPNSGRLTEEYLVGVATKINLDVAKFRADLGSPTVKGGVQRDFDEGQNIGVTGTPAFLVNGKPIIGAQPTAQFEQAIEQAAKSAR